MTASLSIRNVSKRFGTVTAVSDVSLEIRKGEFVTLLGPSGSGKSTLLYMIAGLENATSGDIALEAASLARIPPHKRNIGMVFQRYTLIPHQTVAENVAFPLKVRRWSKARTAERVDAMLRLVRLEPQRDRKPSQLSGGQMQRVALARALAYDPALLLMDEPLAALDKQLKEEIQIEIRRIHRETGVTIVYVTHDQEEALRLSDRIAIFNHGRIEQLGDGPSLYERPASRFVAGFVGNSNFLPGEVMAVSDRAATLRFPDGTLAHGVRTHGSAPVGTGGVVLVRPEDMRLALREPESAAGRLQVVIDDVTHLGDKLEIAVRTQWGQALSIRTPLTTEGIALRHGMSSFLSWTHEQGIFFDERSQAI